MTSCQNLTWLTIKIPNRSPSYNHIYEMGEEGILIDYSVYSSNKLHPSIGPGFKDLSLQFTICSFQCLQHVIHLLLQIDMYMYAQIFKKAFLVNTSLSCFKMAQIGLIS